MLPKGNQWTEVASLKSGDLEVTSYAVILAALARAGRSGVLRLERKPVEKEIHLVTGAPVDCRSNLAHEIFGRFLLSEGVLSEEKHQSALTESFSREIPLGEVLIGRQILTPHEVYRSLQKNLARKLLAGFTWNRGKFAFEEGSTGADETVRIKAPQLILTGVLKFSPPEEIEAAMKSYDDVVLALDRDPPFAATPPKLGGAAVRVVDCLERAPEGIGSLTEKTGLGRTDVQRVIYALILLGLAGDVEEVAGRQAGSAAARSTVPVSPAAVPPAPEASAQVPDQDLLLRQSKIVEAYLSYKRKDSFDFLGLEEGCSAEDIEAAYLEAAEAYSPWSLATVSADDFGEQARLLFLRAARSFAELRDTDARGTLVHRRKILSDQQAEKKKAKFSIETDLLDSAAQFAKGQALVAQAELGKALQYLEFAADCDPQHPVYRAELAYQRHQFDPARYKLQSVTDLEDVLRGDDQNGLAYYYLGLIHSRQGRSVEAEESLRRAVKLMAPDRRPIDALKQLAAKK